MGGGVRVCVCVCVCVRSCVGVVGFVLCLLYVDKKTRSPRVSEALHFFAARRLKSFGYGRVRQQGLYGTPPSRAIRHKLDSPGRSWLSSVKGFAACAEKSRAFFGEDRRVCGLGCGGVGSLLDCGAQVRGVTPCTEYSGAFLRKAP